MVSESKSNFIANEAQIAAGIITNASISASAAIAAGKLALDAVSIQNVAGVLSQQSSQLKGPVITSDFTTTSASLVDVTGMTITLALTNSVATEIFCVVAFSVSAASATVFGMTQGQEVTWLLPNVAQITGQVVRNANITLTPAAATGICPLLMFGYIPTATSPSGIGMKLQASVAGGSTLTVKVGSVLYGTF